MDDKAALLELLKLTLTAKSPDHLGDLMKIGLPLLGALLAAIIAFLSAQRTAEIGQRTQLELAKSTRQTELQKELGNRRGLRFEETITKLDNFNQGLVNYVTLVENVIEVRTSRPPSSSTVEEIQKSEKRFFDGFLDLQTADARLLVLGHGDLQLELRKFGEEAQEIYKEVHLKNSELTVERIEELKRSLRTKRRDLLLRIGHEERQFWSS